jgi:hypothetical protein
MSDETRIVQMALVNHGETAKDGDFTFSMQPRFNPARTVNYALVPSEAEALHKALGTFLRAARKAQ